MRHDLNMSAGKIASQAGHAYLNAFLQNPDEIYLKNPTKICLGANEIEMDKICFLCDKHEIPYTQIIDPDFTIQDNHVVQNNGNDIPAFTAIGIGPIESNRVKKIIGKYKLL